MPFKEPFVLGPFSIDREGRLSPLTQDVSPGFSVRWRGRVVHAQMTRHDGGGSLFIHSSLGRIPSTATDPAIRTACLAVLKGLAGALPDGWTMRMTPDHQPQFAAEMAVGFPITVTDLVTELSSFLVDLSPYLDVLDQAGVSLVAGGVIRQ